MAKAGHGSDPTVSIGMPLYNGQDFIKEALDSLLSQTFVDFEIIVSDNCSTDSSRSIVDTYVAKDTRVCLYQQERNMGPSKNFEFVLNKASGKFFMWAAHDDIWDESWLQVLLDNIHEGDVGIRGLIKLQRHGAIIAEKILPNFKRNQFISCFMRNETDYRSHYAYCLFFREKLLKRKFSSLYVDYYPDALFVYELLSLGALRTTTGTYQNYRVHDSNLGAEYSKKWRGLAKMIYRVHPLRYYRYYLRFTDGAFRKLVIFLLIPAKHIYAQMSFWCRGARQLLLGREVI